MNTGNINNNAETDDNSYYVGTENDKAKLDLKGLFSYPFNNIRLSYTSPTGPAEIYSATRYGRRYVLKGLKEEYRNDPVFTLALAKEFEIGIALDHPNIRRTIGLETVDGIGKVIVLEFIDGNTLKSFVDERKLSLLSSRALVAQMAQAVNYMHSKQIFHRDLKPSNIIVTKSNSMVKIIDFSLSDSDDSIILKNPAGSKKYMAPELLQNPKVSSAAADIYSLGMIMNEIAAVTNDVELVDAARKCINPNPDKRPKTIADIKLPSYKNSFYANLSRFLSSRILTYILVVICLALAVYIISKI